MGQTQSQGLQADACIMQSQAVSDNDAVELKGIGTLSVTTAQSISGKQVQYLEQDDHCHQYQKTPMLSIQVWYNAYSHRTRLSVTRPLYE